MASGDEAPPEEMASEEMASGDEAPPGAPSTGEDVCPDCDGSGVVAAGVCDTCGGTGWVIEAVGGG